MAEIRIPYTRPFDWPSMLAFYRARSIEGVEVVREGEYRRSVSLDGTSAVLAVRDDPPAAALVATLDAPLAPGKVAARLCRVFDLEADLAAVARHLGRDGHLAGLLAARPALRIPGHWDPFETAIRAVLGQQVTLAAARRLAARLVERAGSEIGHAGADRPHRLFPTPRQILVADLSAMGMPGARVRALLAVAEASEADPHLFERGASLDETVARLGAIKGIGPWTAHYIALRACREPDAFPVSDVGLLRGMMRDGRRPSPAELLAIAEPWRPYRAYAAHHIWAALEGSVQ